MNKFMIMIFVLLGLSAVDSTQAAYVVNITEDSSGVLAVGSGRLNLSALETTNVSGLEYQAQVNADLGILGIGPTSGTLVSRYTGITGPQNFGTLVSPPSIDASSGSGSIVAIAGSFSELFVPLDYVSGTDLGTSMSQWSDSTYGSLGLTVGSYSWSWGSGANADSYTLDILSPSTVPEPSSLLMTGGALGVALLVGARRLRKSVS